MFFEEPHAHIYLGSQDCFTLKSILVHTSLECVHLFHLLAVSKKTVFDSLRAATSPGELPLAVFSVFQRGKTSDGRAAFFSATASYSFSREGPPVCTGLTSAQSATGGPSSSVINPYCAQNVKRSPSLNKCARCLAHIPSGGSPPPPPVPAESTRLISRSLPLFFRACIKL